MNTRRIFLTVAALLLGITAGRSDRKTYDDTKTQIALPLATPPVIDGVIDTTEWTGASTWLVSIDPNAADGIRGGTIGDGAGSVPADSPDLSFQVSIGYDANNLYIAVKVTDSAIQVDSAEADSANGNTWMDDSVEVFIDGDNSNFATRDTSGTNPEVVGSGGQFVITANNAYREAEAGNPGYGETAKWYAKTSLTDAGYDAEFRISLSALGNPKPGDVIGFTVGVNDDDDGGAGERQVVWVGMPHTEATYGNLVLEGKSYTAPKSAAPVIDGTINAAEYATATKIEVNGFNSMYDVRAGDDTWEPNDLAFSAWVIHDAEAIYVAVDVTDDNVVNDSAEAGSEDGTTWEDDSIEVLFDADRSRDPARGTGQFEGQYVFTANGAWRDAEANNPTFGATADWFAATTKTATGYQVEYKIKKSALFNPADGALLGFLIAVNDDDGSGRKTQLCWSGLPHSEYTYGALTLGPTGGGGGSLAIESIKVNGDNVELNITTPNASATHAVQQSSGLTPAQWSGVSNVTFSAGASGTTIAKFPKPTSTPAFYRVTMQ